MKAFFALLLLYSVPHCKGFSLAPLSRHNCITPNLTSRSALCAITRNHDEESMMAKMGYHHNIASIAATVAVLGWSACSGSSIAYSPVEASSIDHSDRVGGSSVVVASYSESDFADFSLPSYQEVSAAGINTNLKGGKQLFGVEEASISEASSSSTSSEPIDNSPKKKEPTAADLKAEKAAAKAAQQEARARQQAAVEAAAAAKN